MPNVKMGFEGQLFIGAAGATGATQVLNATDVAYNFDTDTGDTTVRGDGSAIPVETGDVTVRKVAIEWTMINDITDTVLTTIRTALYAGTGLAIRMKDYSAGKGFDGDCTLTMQHGEPLNGQQTLQFSAKPSRSYGRAPLLYT